MQIRFRDWLIIVFFGINLSIILFLTRFSYNKLEQSILGKTKDQLLSINILKKRHLEYYLQNKSNELIHFINYAENHTSTVDELIEMLSDVGEVEGILVQKGNVVSSSSADFLSALEKIKSTTALPENDTLAVFLGDPVFNNRSFLHLIFFRDTTEIHVFLNKRGLQEIVLERSGMGATGESYLVNKDLHMQTPSRFFPDSLPENITVATSGVREAFAGNSGTDLYSDYRNVEIVGAYRSVGFHNLKLALLTEIDLEEALQEALALKQYYIGLTLFLTIAAFFISVLVAKILTRPISALTGKTTLLAKGILPANLDTKNFIAEINEINSSINGLINSLKHTVLFAHEIGSENFAASYNPLSEEDELGKAIVEMRNKLIVLNQQKRQLEMQRKKDLLNAQEKERERIARDIHDGIGPLLTTTKMKISSLSLKEEVKADLIALVDSTIKEIRSVSKNLMPGVLIDFGPAEAIFGMVEDIRKKTGFNISFQKDLSANESKIGKEEGIALFRIAQEAINNALKHSEATEIKVSLTEFDEYVSLFIKDNGKGFDKMIIKTSEGKGLRNIEERVNILGGTVYIESGETGTSIDIEIPHNG